MVYRRWRGVGRVEIGAGMCYQDAAAGRASCGLHRCGNSGMALLAELVGWHIHTLRLHGQATGRRALGFRLDDPLT